MKIKRILVCLCCLVLPIAAFGACAKKTAGSSQASSPSSSQASSEEPSAQPESSVEPEASSQAAAIGEIAEENTLGFDLSFTEREQDASYEEATATKITLSGASATVEGSGASASGSVVTIGAEGTYLLSGTLDDGQILIKAGETEKVQLVLGGVTIHCETGAPLYIQSADKVFLTLAEGSANTLSDGSEYTQTTEDNVDGVIFSKADLALNGRGSLKIQASYCHGIVSKDDLVITSGSYDITANGQGLSGKDCVKILDGSFSLTTQGDGIQSDNEEDAAKGFVYVKGGDFTINSAADGIQAQTLLQISGGEYTITTGGGSANSSTKTQEPGGWGNWGAQTASQEETASAKALKSASQLIVKDGSFTVDSSDDSIHSNGDVTVSGGSFQISSGDDGVHGDSTLTISGGIMNISQSYEGIEASSILISGGDTSVVASDDGLNAAGGNDGSSVDGRMGQNDFSAQSGVEIRITGGKLTVNAEGDGIDSNGNLYVEGGETTVAGPTNSGNGMLDYNGEAVISGGTLVAAGSMGMAQSFGSSSTQPAVLYGFSSTVSAGTEIIVADSTGNAVLSYSLVKDAQCIVLSAPELAQNETYTITAGSETGTFTIDSTSVVAGQSSGMDAGMGAGMGKGMGPGMRGGMGGMGGDRP